MSKELKTITIARDVAVGGQHRAAGTVLSVGTDVSQADAERLVAMRAAAEGGEAKRPRTRRAANTPGAGDNGPAGTEPDGGSDDDNDDGGGAGA